jgi:hypothetical protein
MLHKIWWNRQKNEQMTASYICVQNLPIFLKHPVDEQPMCQFARRHGVPSGI